MTIDHKKKSSIKAHDSWRIFRILSEFVDGFENMANIGPSVSFYGSARVKEGEEFYQLAVDLGMRVAERGFAVITGGGPGLMEAVNKGAQSVGGASCGLGIQLPFETDHNKFVDPRFRLMFRYFFVRKVMFIRYAQAFVFLPGGFGTLDEVFETLTLIQTQKILPIPIFLCGSSYWNELIDSVRRCLLSRNYVKQKDFDLLTITDDPVFVAKKIEDHYAARHMHATFEM